MAGQDVLWLGEKIPAAVTLASLAIVWWMFYGGGTDAPEASLFGGFGISWLLKLGAFVLVANLARRAGLALALRILLAYLPSQSAQGPAGQASLAARLQQVLAQLGADNGQPPSPELQRQVEAIKRDLRAEGLALCAALKNSPKQLSARINAAVRAIASRSASRSALQSMPQPARPSTTHPAAQVSKPAFGRRI